MHFRFIHIVTILFVLASLPSFGQSSNEIVQFTGIVIAEDNNVGIPGVHIYTPAGGRGTTTNAYGYFSMAVKEQDSLLVTAVGFQKQLIVVPDIQNGSFTLVIEMPYDTTYLPEMEVTPYLSEADFKDAILSLRVPQNRRYTSMKERMDEVMIQKMHEHLPQRPGGNHYLVSNTYKYQTATIPMTNPFAWRKFIKDIKKKKNK